MGKGGGEGMFDLYMGGGGGGIFDLYMGGGLGMFDLFFGQDLEEGIFKAFGKGGGMGMVPL